MTKEPSASRQAPKASRERLCRAALSVLVGAWLSTAVSAQEGAGLDVLRVEFVVDPPFAQVWRRDGEGNYDYVGPAGQRQSLDLDRLEARGQRDLVIDFQVRLWFSTWTSPAEYLSVADLRRTGRFPASGAHHLSLTPAQRLQALTRARPVLTLSGLALPALALIALAWVRRRRRNAIPPPLGTIVIAGYSLGERLGAGAMGEVYAARSSEGLECALKFLRPEVSSRPEAAQRFDREISASIALTHPHLLAVYGYGFTKDARLYLATELLRGQTLKEHLKGGAERPPELALQVADQIGSALAYLHQAGLVHRDVKPENIFVRQPENNLVLMDLGLAQTQRDESLTTDGRAMGTPAYMSPEQVRGQPRPQSDQYALGIVLYEILAGQRPFRGLDVSALAHQQIHQAPEPPRAFEPRIPAAAEAVILRMLAKDPEARFATVEEAVLALATALRDQRWQRAL